MTKRYGPSIFQITTHSAVSVAHGLRNGTVRYDDRGAKPVRDHKSAPVQNLHSDRAGPGAGSADQRAMSIRLLSFDRGGAEDADGRGNLVDLKHSPLTLQDTAVRSVWLRWRPTCVPSCVCPGWSLWHTRPGPTGQPRATCEYGDDGQLPSCDRSTDTVKTVEDAEKDRRICTLQADRITLCRRRSAPSAVSHP